jgi:hypothetical protein
MILSLVINKNRTPPPPLHLRYFVSLSSRDIVQYSDTVYILVHRLHNELDMTATAKRPVTNHGARSDQSTHIRQPLITCNRTNVHSCSNAHTNNCSHKRTRLGGTSVCLPHKGVRFLSHVGQGREPRRRLPLGPPTLSLPLPYCHISTGSRHVGA